MKRFFAIFATFTLTAVSAEARETETSTSLGKFVLIEKVSKLEPGDTPIMHVNQNWTKLYLRFVTADRLTQVDIVDDGERLTIDIDAPKCVSTTWPVEYGNERSGASLHSRVEKTVKALFKLCRTLTKAQKEKYLAELRQSRSDFPLAFEGLKTRATQIFGGWQRRCVQYSNKIPGSPFWRPDCVRHSARAKNA